METVPGAGGHGQLIDADEFVRRRGCSVEWLVDALEANRVFCLDVEGDPLFPAFFADPRYEVRQLESVSMQLGTLPGGSKMQFFLNGKGSLGGMTPLQALVAGNFAGVMRAAEGFRER